MNGFWEIQSQWRDYLATTGDISSWIHLDFLRRVQRLLQEDIYRKDIPDSAFYLHELAWFYRLRIWEIISPSGERYQVNFHLFPEGETHIHSHGYEGYSFVLSGKLNYKNFIPVQVSPDEQNDISKSVSLAFQWRKNPEERAKQVFQELEELFLWIRQKVSFSTELFSAFMWGGKDDEFWIFTRPEEIMNLLRTRDWVYYRLHMSAAWEGIPGKNYSVGIGEAHKISVPNQASTLFITRTPKKWDAILKGQEYYHQVSAPSEAGSEKYLFQARNVIWAALNRLKI